VLDDIGWIKRTSKPSVIGSSVLYPSSAPKPSVRRGPDLENDFTDTLRR